mgnify:CR=1 FL=1
MKKTGIFGGSFDPIHIGHLLTAQYLIENRNLDKIIFIPCYVSPHKIEKGTSHPIHRLEMTRIALSNASRFEVSDLEIKKEQISYTVDTLKELKKNFSELELIIGYDNILSIDSWKDPDGIFKLADVVVMKRTTTKSVNHNKYMERAIYVETPVIEISSSQIRERIKNNLPISYYTTEKVADYIYKNKLYIEE